MLNSGGRGRRVERGGRFSPGGKGLGLGLGLGLRLGPTSRSGAGRWRRPGAWCVCVPS